MKLVVVGAAGRMGQTLIRAIDATEGVTVSAAVETTSSHIWERTAASLQASAIMA